MNITTTTERRVARIVTLAPPAPGFGGEGHEAVFVLRPERFADQDPFIMLADDRLRMAPGAQVGGEHPHAGFEIATYALAGGIDEGEEGILNEGDVLWTTAGRGLIHGESAVPRGPTRILQLWFALPEKDRWVDPHFEVTRLAATPVRREPGVVARVYSGASGAEWAERREQVPITMVDVTLDPETVFDQDLPASHNGFLYVLGGALRDDHGTEVQEGQVGWLDRPDGQGASLLRLTAGPSGARLVFYAGQPQHYPIEVQGPFVGGSRADLVRMGREYLSGRYPRMSELARAANTAAA